MTTAEVIATIGSWNLGGVYTEENPSQVQGRLLSIANSGRLKILEMFYMNQKFVPQEYYQRFEVVEVWKDPVCQGDFTFMLPSTITSLPQPKRTGLDGLFPDCDTKRPLTLIYSEREMNQYRNHTSMRNYAKYGAFTITGNQVRGSMTKGEVPSKFLVRAIINDPHKVSNFNIDVDQYPAPDGFISDLKKLIASDEGRKALIPSDQVSNSKTDIENANAATRR